MQTNKTKAKSIVASLLAMAILLAGSVAVFAQGDTDTELSSVAESSLEPKSSLASSLSTEEPVPEPPTSKDESSEENASEIVSTESPESSSVEVETEAMLVMRAAFSGNTTTVDDVAALTDAINDAQILDPSVNPVVIKVTGDFIDDILMQPTAVSLAMQNDKDIILDFDNYTLQGASTALFSFANPGSGSYTLVNGVLKGNVRLAAGEYNLKNITFAGFAAVALNTGTGHVNITDCLFDGTTNAIIAGSGSMRIENTTIQNTTSYAIAGAKNTEIYNSIFQNNASGQGGAALRLHSDSGNSTILIQNTSFLGNISAGNGYNGGAIELNNITGLNLTIEDCYFYQNTIKAMNSHGIGGAIGGYRVNNSTIKILRSVFEENSTTGNVNTADGGAIGIKNNGGSGQTTFTVDGCNFTGNTAGNDGGAMLLEGGQTTDLLDTLIINSTFTGNQAGLEFKQNGLLDRSCGSAIQFYGMTNSTITHSTFYANSVKAGIGTGGAVSLNTGSGATTPRPPILSNNIFVANTAGTGKSTYGNVYIMTEANADPSDPAAALKNNGNVGFDNGNNKYYNGVNTSAYIEPKNVFADTVGGVPNREYFGDAVGAAGAASQCFCFIVSPLTDEMYRDGSGPYYDPDVRTDVRGYPRDYYPNAGAVEIYWTKFDPNSASGGYWIDPPTNSIQSLNYTEQYYLVTEPNGTVTTFPRTSFERPGNDGFAGWESNQPSNPTADPADFEYPLVQPSLVVPSTKQTYTAKWIDKYRVDFDSQGGSFVSPILNVVSGSTINKPSDPSLAGYDFAGWYKESACTNPWRWATDTVAKDITLYAKWTIKDTTPEYDVVFVASPGGPTPASVKLPANSLVPEPAAPSFAGYKFDGWQRSDGTFWNFSQSRTPAAPLTLYAKYTPLAYTVTFVYNNGVDANTNVQVLYGSAVAEPQQPTRSGYTFNGWEYTGTGRLWLFAQDTMPAKNITLTAIWSRNSITPPDSTSRSTTTTSRGGGGGGVSTTSQSSSIPSTSMAPSSSSPSASPSQSVSSATVVQAPSAVSQSSQVAAVSLPEDPTLSADVVDFFGIPLGGLRNGDGWSLLNLILSILMLLSAVLFLYLWRTKRTEADEKNEEETQEQVQKRSRIWTVLALISGILPLVLFFLLEHFTTMLLFSRWTPLFLLLTVVHICLAVTGTLWHKQHTKEPPKEQQQV